MNRVIRIGSRDSELALWQARTVQHLLLEQEVESEIIEVKSDGDLQTSIPLYEMGITGIFTRALDLAMLNEQVDMAVHSLKDVPTRLPRGIVEAAVLKRSNPRDVLVHKGLDFLNEEGIIATGSLRRKSQWLYRYPLHEVEDLRGNVPTRLRKLEENEWNAAIFAAAGLERLELMPENHVELRWMIPAPAQGAIVVAALEKDTELREILSALNDHESQICTRIEREFLQELEGGCSAPIGALAEISGDKIHFRGCLGLPTGEKLLTLEEDIELEDSAGFGRKCARKILAAGGDAIMQEIKMQPGQ